MTHKQLIPLDRCVILWDEPGRRNPPVIVEVFPDRKPEYPYSIIPHQPHGRPAGVDAGQYLRDMALYLMSCYSVPMADAAYWRAMDTVRASADAPRSPHPVGKHATAFFPSTS